jgi:hypothetical protein
MSLEGLLGTIYNMLIVITLEFEKNCKGSFELRAFGGFTPRWSILQNIHGIKAFHFFQ